MKYLTWIFAFLVLFALTVPAMGTESAPAGDIVIELSTDIGPFDPVPAVDAREVFPGYEPAEIRSESVASMIESQHQAQMGAHDHTVCVFRDSLLSLTRLTYEADQPAALRLWRSKGGDGGDQGPKPAARVLVT